MSDNNEWFRVSSGFLPRDEALVEWTTSKGDVVRGYRKSNVWFLMDGTYVYYTPVCWRYL